MSKTPIAVLALTVGCLQPFETPSAYEDQRYLCANDNADALWEEVDHCSAAPTCGGVASFTGTLGGQPVTVESHLDSSMVRLVTLGEARMLDGVDLGGSGPYFQFVFGFESIGGDWDVAVDAPRTFGYAGAAGSLESHLDDTWVEASLRLSAAGDSTDLAGTDGELIVEEQAPTYVHLSFSGVYGNPEDLVEGCIHVLPLEVGAP
ncbi:MAG: hypothetical protein JRI25_14740 [Deltaproteobacteria bacterium]|nr:hypothetical protein [Deltaproteobacteria bacterium]MBW2255837.1 hypothetical protein [Deltaproteobacteria bacterium]